MSMDSKPLKASLNRLAQRLTTPEGGAVLAQLQALAMMASAARAPGSAGAGKASPAATASAEPRIGIWEGKAHADGTRFVRSPRQQADWRFWADTEALPPKSERRRVLFFGESVARGYFFDPALTPARFLEQSLSSATGCEVIDLARTDLRPAELMTLIKAAPALQPDALVVYAGNNWHYGGMLAPADMLVLAEAVADGAAALRDAFLRSYPRSLARQVVQTLASTSAALKIPAVLVIPGFNLADWIDDAPLPLLPGDGNRRWEALRSEAEQALGGERYPELESIARQMIALDGALSPTSQVLLARACAGQGRFAAARDALQAACDAICGLPCPSSPRCPRALQEALRGAAHEAGIAVVDVPELLAARDQLPGRRWFMDYCHHSAEGLAAVVDGIAHTLARVVPGLSVASGRATRFEVGASDAAMAHFLAAIHNSHFNQPPRVLEHHCARALELDPAIGPVMQAFLRFRTLPGHDWLHDAFADFCEYASARRYVFRDAPHKNDKRLTYSLHRAITHALREASVAETSPPPRPPAPLATLDLLQPAHWLRSTWGHDEHAAFVTAREPATEFWFLRPEPCAYSLLLCCRVPGGAEARSVRILVNGVLRGEARVGRDWTNVALHLPPDPAAVRITIAWPELVADHRATMTRAQQRIECGAKPDVYPRYGEIFQLTASPLPRGETHAPAAATASSLPTYAPVP